ncbi:hypothetical protein J7L05_08930 [bacterium]|nr:hypothetical protein [bacterium]
MLFSSRFFLLITTIILILVISGCSGGGKTPAMPDMPSGDLIADSNNGAAIEGIATGLLGVYQIAIDLGTMESEITPSRKLGSIGDIALPDVTQYFISTPCGNCFNIDALGITDEGWLDIVFKMKHPYQETSKRKDLDVFDVRGIMIFEGDTTFNALPHIDLDGDGFVDSPPQGNFDKLANADGYTFHYDNVALDLFGLDIEGSLNPYRNFFVENNPDPDYDGVFIPWHKMAQGSPFDKKHYLIKLDDGGETLNLIFVIEASYGQSAIFSVPSGDPGSRLNPMYFNPEFNRKEAYDIRVDPIENLTAADLHSETTVTIHVEDWQNSQSPDWNMEDPGSIRYRSNVASVYLSVPEISSTLYTTTTADSGNGTHLNPYVFSFDVLNDQGALEGEYTGLVAVMDQYQEDGRTVYGISPSVMFTTFTNYEAITIIAEEGFVNNDPVAVGSADPNPAESDQTISLIDGDSYDPDFGDYIAKYEWDFDISNGVNFTDSISTSPNQAQTSYTNTTGSNIEITARLRVTDSHNATGTTDVIITVQSTDNTPPVAVGSAVPNPANHNQSVTLIDSDSHDDDPGDYIALYEWDYDDRNGVDFLDSVSTTPNQGHAIYQNTSGSDIQITATLRVTDSHSAPDTTEVIITVHTEQTSNNDPIAIANANPNPVTSGRDVQLLDILSHDPDDPPDYIATYKWDVDIYNGVDWDHPDYESDQPNQAIHVYSNTGLDPIQFTARLRVYDSHGAWGEDDITITVNPNQLPVAVCDAEPNPTRGGIDVHFIDSDSYDPDPLGEIIKFEWDFDYDLVTFDIDHTSPNPDDAYHAYENMTADTIIFTAALRVTDNALTTDICTVDVTVEPNNPPVAVGYADPNPVIAEFETVLHAEGSYDNDPGDSISKIQWDFEYEGTFEIDEESTEVTDTFPYIYHNATPDPIEITAMLRVFDESELYDDMEVIVTVNPELPIPVITHTENKTMNNTGLTFTMKSFNTQATNIAWNGIGYWDFTAFGTSSTYVEEFIDPDGAEFTGYRSDYPDATTVFKAPGSIGTGYGPRYYDNTGNGYQCELGQESSALGPGNGYLYNNPVKIPFPMDINYTEMLFANGMIADILAFSMTYHIDAVGYGLVKTELGTFNCLLVRTYTLVSVQGMDDEEFITYEWLSDEGRKIGTASSQTFDPITYVPLGSIKCARLTSHN